MGCTCWLYKGVRFLSVFAVCHGWIVCPLVHICTNVVPQVSRLFSRFHLWGNVFWVARRFCFLIMLPIITNTDIFLNMEPTEDKHIFKPTVIKYNLQPVFSDNFCLLDLCSWYSLQSLRCPKKKAWIFPGIILFLSGEGNGNPLQYSCLENPRDRGVWWAAIYGVAQSRTWLKQLSSSSSSILFLSGVPATKSK